MDSINTGKVANATKWSAITETLAKIISPCLNLILARILTPEAFGIAATVMMIVSFADLFANAGFGKFLIQHQFKDEREKWSYTDTAFISNFAISCMLFLMLVCVGEQIATLVGNPGYGRVVSVAGVLLILTSFSSIQMALFRRELLFKKLLVVRLAGALIPIVTTVPLALMGWGHEALLAGYIAKEFVTAVMLTIQSEWKPHIAFQFSLFRNMFWFSFWSMIELFGQWIRENIPIFIVGRLLSARYVGLYKTTITTVNSICALIYSSLIPVVYSVLSREQNNERSFNYYFQLYSFIGCALLFPIGVGTFVFRETITNILLGNQWGEISDFLGLYCLCLSIYSAISPICFEAFRAKGKPYLSAFIYSVQNGILILLLILNYRRGFDTICGITALSLLIGVPVQLILCKTQMGLKLQQILKTYAIVGISTAIMAVVGLQMKFIAHILPAQLVAIILCGGVYSVVLFSFPSSQEKLKTFLQRGKVK